MNDIENLIQELAKPETKEIMEKIVLENMAEEKQKNERMNNIMSNMDYINWLINFMKNKGTPIAIVYSPNFMKDFLDLVKPYTIICKKCGKQFEPSPKGQRELCSECYKQQRRINKTQTMRNLRMKK